MILLLYSFEYWALINKEVTIITHVQGRREMTGWGAEVGAGGRQASHHFLEQKFFSHVKSEDIKFVRVNNIWRLKFISWTRHKWQEVDSFF